jgi:hypothetical protein
MTLALFDRLTTIRRAAQRLAELGCGEVWADLAADLDEPIARLWPRAVRERRRALGKV